MKKINCIKFLARSISVFCLRIDYDAKNDMFFVISLKLLYREELAIQYKDTDLFSLTCCSHQSSIEPFVARK